jgi:tryptophan synthase beta chain
MAPSDPRQTKFVLDESRIPRAWYNIAADLPVAPPPPLHPGTHEPIGPDDLAPLFPMALIGQEVSAEREIEIPEPVRDAYRLYRPSPLYRAHRLEKALDTPAHIYYKYEGVSPAGSHKPNTAIPQAFYNKEAGVKRLATETGAGQWGSALAFAGALFGLEVKVYMVRASYDQKPYRRVLMETYGAEVVASPSLTTNYGRSVLASTPDSPGSLGIAISEAVEDAATRDDTKYSLGSVLNHVLLHQTVIGQEALEQMAMAGESPDIVIGCTGGGSNFAGLTFPFLGRNFRDGANHRIIAVEPEAAPSLTRGVYAYDFGDTGKLTPLVKMHTLGSDFIPEPIHAGGLRYHGMAPLVSLLKENGSSRHGASTSDRASRRVSRSRGRRDPAGAGADSRHPHRDRRGARGEGGRRGPGDPVQPVRPRPLRPVGLRALPDGRPGGLRVPARAGRGGAGGPSDRVTGRSGVARTDARILRCGAARGVVGCGHATTRLLVVWTADLHGRPARLPLRRGAPLSSLRRVPQRGTARGGAAEDHATPEPTDRPGTTGGGWGATRPRPAHVTPPGQPGFDRGSSLRGRPRLGGLTVSRGCRDVAARRAGGGVRRRRLPASSGPSACP